MATCVSAFCVISMSSCTLHYGNKELLDQSKNESLVPGKSTKEDVYRTFGQPSVVKSDKDSGSLWRYWYRPAKSNMVGMVPVMGLNLVAGGKNGNVTTRDYHFNSDHLLIFKEERNKELYTHNAADLGRLLREYVITDESQKEVKKEMEGMGHTFDTNIAHDSQVMENALSE